MTVRRFSTTLLGQILDPRLCPGCQQALIQAQIFCSRCQMRLLQVNRPCRLCGLEKYSDDDICAVCLYDPPRWQQLIAPLQYQGLARELLLQLKFSESLYLANTLVRSVIGRYIETKHPPEALLPVPLHQNRLFDRGFNQAFEIARTLSTCLNIELDYKTLSRIRDTDAQAGLSTNRREKNILKAFSCLPTNYRHVAVVDDIVTTGSTANEITKTLHRAGIEKVEIWGLARVVKY